MLITHTDTTTSASHCSSEPGCVTWIVPVVMKDIHVVVLDTCWDEFWLKSKRSSTNTFVVHDRVNRVINLTLLSFFKV